MEDTQAWDVDCLSETVKEENSQEAEHDRSSSSPQPHSFNPFGVVIMELIDVKQEDFKEAILKDKGDWYADPNRDPLSTSPNPVAETDPIETDPVKYETPEEAEYDHSSSSPQPHSINPFGAVIMELIDVKQEDFKEAIIKDEGHCYAENPIHDPLSTSPNPVPEIDPLKTEPVKYETSEDCDDKPVLKKEVQCGKESDPIGKHTLVRGLEDGNESIMLNEKRVHSYLILVSGDASPKCHLKTHQSVHTPVKSFICATCGKSFSRKESLKTHQSVHSGVKSFTCATCGKSLSHKNSLVTHQSIHSGVKSFTCATCGKSFSRKGYLKFHQSVHLEEKLCTCSICGKSFSRKGYLKTHLSLHTGVKSFTCATCGKSFSCSSSLKTHQRVHSAVKAFTCTTCGKSFSLKGYLKTHQSLHSGVKSFTCTTCGKSFSLKSYLKAHQMVHLVKGVI